MEANWTNRSVLALAGDEDPVRVITERARDLVVDAVDRGWTGPPYNPLELAGLLGVETRAANLRVDARVAPNPEASSGVLIEFNPQRPWARVRFSIAHELAHLLFPDAHEAIRERAPGGAVEMWSEGDDWQLEALCNIAAAELLMPTQTLEEMGIHHLDIDHLMGIRARLQVSTEALLRRVVGIANQPLTMLAAHAQDGIRETVRTDYTTHSAAGAAVQPKFEIPARSILNEITAIGYTVKKVEDWDGPRLVQGVGLPPYPGQWRPRVLALICAHDDIDSPISERVREVPGNMFPLVDRNPLILHLVTDGARRWHGQFARQLSEVAPAAHEQFQQWARARELPLPLGEAVLLRSLTEPPVCCLVAQEGYGPATAPRIRYPALKEALRKAAEFALELGATVHSTKIGTGQARGHWPLIRDLMDQTIAARGVDVVVHVLGDKR